MLAKRIKNSSNGTAKPRLKLMLFGTAGVGKTYGSMWPDSYIFDSERGTVHYDKMLQERNCARVLTSDVLEACDHLRDLIVTKHDYKTVVVDPITAFYEDSQNKWTDLFVKNARGQGDGKNADLQDFGFRYWGKVKAEQKAFLALLKRVDMNVICTAHEKNNYGDNMKVIGQTYDGLKGLDYLFDTVIRIVKQGDKRVAFKIKDRTGKFPDRFDYTYDKILELWGEGIERSAESVEMASPEQVRMVKELLTALQIDDEWEVKCLRKADVNSWDEMDAASIQKCIDYLSKRVPNIERRELVHVN